MSNHYDFIVVGAGAAGCAIASGLATSDHALSVLLIEAGPSHDDARSNLLHDRWTTFMTSPNSTSAYITEEQHDCNSRSIPYPQGKVLGGGTAINMCTYTVGPRDDYERWANEVNDLSFGWASSVRIRKKFESYAGVDDLSADQRQLANPDMDMHGTSGPIHVEFPKVFEPVLQAQIDAAKKFGLGFTEEPNNGNPLGLAATPSTAHKSVRVTAASAYLSPKPTNLEIITDSQVSRILMDGKKATGVVANGETYFGSREIIISAGAVGTPKLLMLSGIGDTEKLQKLSIPVVHDLPAIGQNLQDHFFTILAWELKEDQLGWSKFYTSSDKVAEARARFAADGTGPLSVYNGTLSVGFFKADGVLSTPEFAALPQHVQDHIRKPTVPIWEGAFIAPPFSRGMDYSKPYLTTAIFLHVPQSTGTINLASSNPDDAPLIDPRFFSHPFDRSCALAATRALINFVEKSSLAENVLKPVDVPASDSDDDILSYWRQAGTTTWHPSGTVKMGKPGEADACVDSSFRIMGLQNLRVADMSVTPFLPNCHTQSVAYFVGELAVEKIIAEHNISFD